MQTQNELAVQADGFVENMPFDDYARVPALNGSSIIHMRRSPMKFKHERDNPTPPSDAMILGTATHRLILEPDTIGDFAIWGAADGQNVRRGKVWDQFQFDNEGKFILTKDLLDSMVGIAIAAAKNPDIRKYTQASGPTELSMFWTHPHTKRKYKARLDKVCTDTHTIFDLKTCRDCHAWKFSAAAYSLGYHIKMALQWYGYKTLLGIEPKMRLGAIDQKPPHESACYRLPPDVLLQGIEECDQLVARLDQCEKTGKWPADQEEEMDLTLPTWATESQEEME